MSLYKIAKTFESPTGRIHAGVIKSEKEWMSVFAGLNEGDCAIKHDWFDAVDADSNQYVTIDVTRLSGKRYNMCQDQPAQIDCGELDCIFNSHGACNNISPALSIKNGKATCWSGKKK